MDDLWIDIYDNVFLPSANEMKNTNYWSNDASRIATGTDYAKCQGLFVDGGNSYWYLRSPADNSYTACAVSTDGTLYSYDYYYNRYSFFTSSNTTGIRPAIKLNNLNSDTVKKSANPEKAINVPQAKKLDFFSKAKAFFVNIIDITKYFLTPTADSNEKAVAVINSVSKGINMPCMESGWARDYILEKDTFENVKNKGFDYIRLPVNFASMLDYDGKLNESAMFNLDTVLQYAMDAGLTVILDFHGWVELNDNLTADNIETLISIWKQVAERYVDYPEQLCFEIYNEPSNTSGKMTSAKWNYIQNTTTAAIRAVDDDRIIVLSPESYNAASKLSSLCVNKRDKHLIIDVHNYAPMEFTHQGAEWINGYDDTVSYSDEIADEFANSIKVVAKYQEKKHIKVIIGEFGVYLKQAKTEDVSAFLTSAVDVMDENNLPWCYWEYNQGFGAYDYHKKEWKPFVVDSLIK